MSVDNKFTLNPNKKHWGAVKGFMRYISVMNQVVIYGANEATKFKHGQHQLCGQHDVHI